eukprot:m.115808 g.115808  ORF g.115808 m.115808 type:complete len:52 (+) comp15380_c0_seq6:682-837(+)
MQLLLLLSLNLLFVLLTGKDPADVIRAMESGLTRCMAALTSVNMCREVFVT